MASTSTGTSPGRPDSLGAAGGLRLDAVQGASPVLPRARGEDRRAQLRRDQLRDQVRGARAVRARPDRARVGGVRNRPDRAAAAVGARSGRRLRRVPLGRAAAAARRLGDGVPLLCGRAHRAAPEDALARHRRPGRSRPAGRAVPRTVRRCSRRAQPRLPGYRLNGQKAQATPCPASLRWPRRRSNLTASDQAARSRSARDRPARGRAACGRPRRRSAGGRRRTARVRSIRRS